jgi:hypothetical protein
MSTVLPLRYSSSSSLNQATGRSHRRSSTFRPGGALLNRLEPARRTHNHSLTQQIENGHDPRNRRQREFHPKFPEFPKTGSILHELEVEGNETARDRR